MSPANLADMLYRKVLNQQDVPFKYWHTQKKYSSLQQFFSGVSNVGLKCMILYINTYMCVYI